MQLHSDEGAKEWVRAAGFQVDGALPSTLVRIAAGQELRLRVRIPEEATAAVALAYVLLMTAVPGYDEESFAGGLVWLQRWEIWSESIDRAGYALLDGIRAAGGSPAPVGSTPAHAFGRGELAAAHAALSLPMLFQWDAHFVPTGGDFFAFVSHEGYLELVSGGAVHGELLERFGDWYPAVFAPAEPAAR